MEYKPGVRLGIDVGRARVGVARSDSNLMIATPIVTLARSENTVAEIADIARDEQASLIYVGLPLSLSGADTPSTQDAREIAAQLSSATAVPVRLIDERLSTVSAQRSLREVGRSQKKSRSVIDQIAAVVLLQAAIDQERNLLRPSGIEI